MDTVNSPIDVFNPRQPIPGYVLQERIGAGGFGEVWRAEAPGGLMKAVKIVYGPAQATKAERELKALNRIKQVHHPLLLSLERIEVVDGHLVIVTEIADGSLQDRFELRLSEGHSGIPRDELLSFMRDAAEALDYLYDTHSLQHLDIKPENLLLLANRVKVADFGMVKDLQERSETLIGGLTPVYAPPEIYDGKPSRNSDQYSLAIVFQQMLTNELPFAGRTTAQLAAQHMHSEPDLSSLSEGDRQVIGRALSKDARRRYSNCCEMVDALKTSRVTPQQNSQRRSRASQTAWRNLRDRRRSSSNATSTLSVPSCFPCQTDIESLPPLAPVDPATAFLPTIFLGVGGLAGKTMQHLRRQITQRIGNIDELPALRFLLLDSDPNTVADCTRGDGGSALQLNETIAIPLREATYYRAKSDALLEWLHRRWLYNIPRTLRTEGIRSLGRLAFVDHFHNIEENLRQLIEEVRAETSIAQSRERSGHPFDGRAVRVCLMGSAAGGTSGGLILDLAYAVRNLLAEEGLDDDQVLGMLTLGTVSGGRSKDLQVANTLSFLRELGDFSTQGRQYPGEPDCNIPAFQAHPAPFAKCYLTHLGDNLNPREVEQRANLTADYLYANLLSNAAPYFAACRQDAPFESFAPGECRVRTFSFASIGGSPETIAAAADSLGRQLVRSWIGGSTQNGITESELDDLAGKLFEESGIHVEPLVKKAVEMLMPPPHIEASDLTDEVVAFALKHAENDQDAASLIASMDHAFLSQPKNEKRGEQSMSAARWMELRQSEWQTEEARTWDNLMTSFLCLSQQSRVHLSGVHHVLRRTLTHLSDTESEITRHADQYTDEIADFVKERSLWLRQVASLRFRRRSLRLAAGFLHQLHLRLREFSHQLNGLERKLEEFSHEFPLGDVNPTDIPELDHAEWQKFSSVRWQLVEELDHTIKQQMVDEQGTIFALADANGMVWRRFATRIRQASRSTAASFFATHRLRTLLDPSASLAPRESVEEWLRSVTPTLAHCGGKQRVLLMIPRDQRALAETLAKILQETEFRHASIIPVDGTQVSVAFEFSELPLENVMIDISGGRKEYLELAQRLHTRKDVDWS